MYKQLFVDKRQIRIERQTGHKNLILIKFNKYKNYPKVNNNHKVKNRM